VLSPVEVNVREDDNFSTNFFDEVMVNREHCLSGLWVPAHENHDVRRDKGFRKWLVLGLHNYTIFEIFKEFIHFVVLPLTGTI
jgi:hypothetical protein